jgi:hypothetical protein
MSRYIDADKFEARINASPAFQNMGQDGFFLREIVLQILDGQPTADVVAVVRCKDCKHWGGVTYGQMCRKYSGSETKVCTEKDHYCSYGERREE